MTTVYIKEPQKIFFQRTAYQLKALISDTECDIRTVIDDNGLYTWIRNEETGNLWEAIYKYPDGKIKNIAESIAKQMIHPVVFPETGEIEINA